MLLLMLMMIAMLVRLLVMALVLVLMLGLELVLWLGLQGWGLASRYISLLLCSSKHHGTPSCDSSQRQP